MVRSTEWFLRAILILIFSIGFWLLIKDDYELEWVIIYPIYLAITMFVTKGSIPYIGIYRKETDQVLDLVNIKEIWKQFVSKEGVYPKDDYQRAIFNFNYIEVYFRTMTEKSVYVSLTVENDKIKDQGRDR